jgi:hypothetical protein
MRLSIAVQVGVALLAIAAPAAAEVRLTIENGQVSLAATNATPRDILAEWAKVGQTRIVNAERVPGGPLTLQLDGVAEDQALEIILRSAAGYVTAPRSAAVPNASRYDRILVMPTTTPTRAAPPPQPAFPQPRPPQFQPPMQIPQPIQPPIDDDDVDTDAGDEPAPNVVLPNPRGPVFNGQPMQLPPQQQAVPQPPSVFPRPGVPSQAPIGVAVPGMPVPVPQQPGQPGVPVTPPDFEP